MIKLSAVLQPYHPNSPPYQSLPQAALILLLMGLSIAGIMSLKAILLVPALVMVVALEVSAWPQVKHCLSQHEKG